MQNQIGADIANIINLSALTVSQLLESAQEKGCDIKLETASIENQVSRPVYFDYFDLYSSQLIYT